MRPSLLLLMSSWAYLLFACSNEKIAGTGVGNPEDKIQASISLGVTPSEMPLIKNSLEKVGVNKISRLDSISIEDLSGTVFNIDSIRVHIRNLKIDLPDNACDLDMPECEQNEIDISGPFVINLLTKVSTPEIPEVTLPTGVYSRLDIRLEDADVEDGVVEANDILIDNTLFFSGIFAYGGVSNRRLTVLLNFSEDARFENDTGIELSGNGVQELKVEFDPSLWLQDLNIIECIESDELAFDEFGDLTITDDQCNELEKNIKLNVKESGQLN